MSGADATRRRCPPNSPTAQIHLGPYAEKTQNITDISTNSTDIFTNTIEIFENINDILTFFRTPALFLPQRDRKNAELGVRTHGGMAEKKGEMA
jgi:hypothetical protein